ncbi:hypothetical protein ACLQ3K_24940 [Tsukamurella sp. DT100]|uniref:hypothetical protein n=1 Tax=Tsukamurella sp. DT100 TaxID=3393415 RepID=UPI003CE87D88
MNDTPPGEGRSPRKGHPLGAALTIVAVILMWISSIATVIWSMLVASLGSISCSSNGGCNDFLFFFAIAVWWGGSVTGLTIGHYSLVRADTNPRKVAVAAGKGLGTIAAAALLGTALMHFAAFA